MYSPRLEGIAADLLSSSCTDPPVDALELAAACGLHVLISPVHGGALLYDGTIYVSPRVSVTQLHERVAHEIGHWALERAREDDSEEAADYLARALLLPRDALLRDLRHGWDLRALTAKYAFAAPSTVAVRVAELRAGTAAIYDYRMLARRVGPPHEAERDLLDAALRTSEPVRLDALTGAWPIGPRGRVVVLASAA